MCRVYRGCKNCAKKGINYKRINRKSAKKKKNNYIGMRYIKS